METLIDVSPRPVVHPGNYSRVAPDAWRALLARLLGAEPAVRLLTPRKTWRTVRTVADLQAYVRDGGRVW